jgi:hypothetical protein
VVAGVSYFATGIKKKFEIWHFCAQLPAVLIEFPIGRARQMGAGPVLSARFPLTIRGFFAILTSVCKW